MEPTGITADHKLTLPLRWADVPVKRAPDETDAAWAERKDETTLEPVLWGYHTPISRDVFEANWRVISATQTAIVSKGLGYAMEQGPLIARMALKDAARIDAIESGLGTDGDTSSALLAEIKRLTLVLAPGPNGYDNLPVDVAIKRGVLSADDWIEAESSLVFFTCGWWMVRRELREPRHRALALVLRGSITSSDITAFAASLQPSTTGATSAAQPATPQATAPTPAATGAFTQLNPSLIPS